ncbi:Gentisate 1,2-dioxygenase [Paramyrothecium foliicola]|nr:Gentisate 1,2-dioxygenase [Paramyrothecium foliicola]
MGINNAKVAAPEQKTTEMKEYLEGLPPMQLEPLWSRMGAMVPASPNPKAKPFIWRYSEVYPQLEAAGKLVPEEEAERRVLMLVNPNMEAPHTTDTIYGGLQWVNPGETAPAHRHIAYACRFIIEGDGFTAVEGKKMPLARGDVVLTPTWHWHDHGNESDSPVIWLDILNLPLFRFSPVHFAEGYSEKRYPSTHCDPCEWRFPWAPVQAILDSQKGAYAVHHYKKKKDGSQLSTTLGVQAERLAPGASSDVLQDSSSFIYHCIEGKGRTTVEPPSGESQVFEWSSQDTFAVPAWSKIQHFNDSSSEPAYLFAGNDNPFIDLLGLRRP